MVDFDKKAIIFFLNNGFNCLNFWAEKFNFMNYRSKIFIFSGLYALLAIFLAKKMYYDYYYGGLGLNQLPINLFEILLFALAVITILITFITISFLVKRSNQPVSFKKRFNLLIPSFMGLIIIFLLFNTDRDELVVPVAILIYGLILLNLNRFVTSRLVIFGLVILALGITAFFLTQLHWVLLILVFGILPILFGILTILKPSKAS